MSEAPHLLVDEIDGILVATLNRPEKLNAISDEMMVLFEDVRRAAGGASKLLHALAG